MSSLHIWPVEENDVPWPMLPHQRQDPLHQQGVPLWWHWTWPRGKNPFVWLPLFCWSMCCETESFWKLAESQCKVKMLVFILIYSCFQSNCQEELEENSTPSLFLAQFCLQDICQLGPTGRLQKSQCAMPSCVTSQKSWKMDNVLKL